MRRIIYVGTGLLAGVSLLLGIAFAGGSVSQASGPQQQPPTPTSPQASAYLGVMLDDANGKVIVRDVVKDGPAAKAGIQRYDQLVAIDGVQVASVQQAQAAVGSKQPGDVVQIDLNRSGQSVRVSVTLAQPPAPRQFGPGTPPGAGPGPQGPQGPGGPRTPRTPQGPRPPQAPQGPLPKVFDDLRNFARDQIFDRLRGGTFSYADKDGKKVTIETVPGKVISVDANAKTVTIKKNDGGASATYAIDGNARLRGISGLGDLNPGDSVTVTLDQANPGVALSVAKAGAGAGLRGFGGMMPSGNPGRR